jgi:predicted DsbA family dithiol-disulfide isomerase
MPDRDPAPLVAWIDPGCPWAWQTARWLRELRDRGLVSIEWRLFSLELNTAGFDLPFAEAADRYGEALMTMALARREAGNAALEAFYVAIGTIVHDDAEPISAEVVRRAAAAAGMPGMAERARADPSLAEEIVQEYRDAREVDVFGVPSLRLGDAPAVYGPILPEAPTGDDALEWWGHISWLIGHEDVYELKRWPRARRPGTSFTSP